MMRVNNREFEWREGQTLEALLDYLKTTGEFGYLFVSDVTVIVNGTVIPREEYKTRAVWDGDSIRVFPQLIGG